MKRYLIVALFITIFCGSGNVLLAGTTVTSSPDNVPVADMIAGFQNKSDAYGTAIAQAYALGNISGYAIGSSYLGSVPHLYIGFGLNAGLTNMQRFDGDKNAIPGFGLNPTFMFGLGLGKGLDILGKAFIYSSGMYKPPVDTAYLKLNKLNIYSFGGKLRYNIIKRKTLMPGVFHFEGITLSAGADAMYGQFKFSGNYANTFNLPVSGTDTDVGVDMDYTADLNYLVISGNTQAIVYANVFFLFNVYTGLGLALNFGSINSDLTVDGPVTGGTTGTLTAASKNKYKPNYFMPTYILGIEVDLFAFQICLESMVDLTNGQDINMALSIRSQW